MNSSLVHQNLLKMNDTIIVIIAIITNDYHGDYSNPKIAGAFIIAMCAYSVYSPNYVSRCEPCTSVHTRKPNRTRWKGYTYMSFCITPGPHSAQKENLCELKSSVQERNFEEKHSNNKYRERNQICSCSHLPGKASCFAFGVICFFRNHLEK